MTDEPLIRDVSDTARWVAVYRARETERPDSVFQDPFARALAGDRGEQIAQAIPFGDETAWAFTARTYAFDRLIDQALAGWRRSGRESGRGTRRAPVPDGAAAVVALG